MPDRPILARDSVALAIREGRQTQHRVPMKVQPEEVNGRIWGGGMARWSALQFESWEDFRTSAPNHAPWQAGDMLWLRETWQLVRFSKDFETGIVDEWHPWEGAIPTACPARWDVVFSAGQDWPSHKEDRGFNWRPSIHMPRWAARTWVKVTRVWVERVRDISAEDAMAEGLIRLPSADNSLVWWGAAGRSYLGVRRAFEALWESLYRGSWERNDWVWCCAFELDRERSGVRT